MFDYKSGINLPEGKMFSSLILIENVYLLHVCFHFISQIVVAGRGMFVDTHFGPHPAHKRHTSVEVIKSV